MLRQLFIKNIAIAENIEVEFDSGFNVITGETGAGKSILVHSLHALRSGKLDSGSFFSDTQVASVCAEFVISSEDALVMQYPQFFESEVKLGAPNPAHSNLCPLTKKSIIVKRQFLKCGRCKSYINDDLVASKTVNFLMEELIDINSQFDNQKLINPQLHIGFLDRYLQSETLTSQISANYAEILSLTRKIQVITSEIALAKRELDLYSHEAKLIDEAQISIEEWENVQTIVKKSQLSNQIRTHGLSILSYLRDGELNCFMLLQKAKKHLDKMRPLLQGCGQDDELPQAALPDFSTFESLDSDLLNVEKVLQLFDEAEDSLTWALERELVYNKILVRFGNSIEKVLDHRKKCLLHFQKLSQLELTLESHYLSLRTYLEETLLLAKTLSNKRKLRREELSTKIETELSLLGMPKARFVTLLSDNQGTLRFSEEILEHLETHFETAFVQECQNLASYGLESCQFLMSANEGHVPGRIEKVASGGELSRIMLALKAVLLSSESLSVFVFDEIDAGISGRVASMVGRKMADFCLKKQAICITHLPQVACFSTTHFVVTKSLKGGKAQTQIQKTADPETLQELAKLISGETISDESLAQARRLRSDAVRSLEQ